MELSSELKDKFSQDESGIFTAGHQGYWSNLAKAENQHLIQVARQEGPRKALQKLAPHLENIIYSPKRGAGLELLDLKGSEVCIDYGCMWGALTIPLSKRTQMVLGVDQTLESLQFLKIRAKDESISNVELLCHDIRNLPDLQNKVDVAVVNGVLEWVPEEGPIEIGLYYGKFATKTYSALPGEQQERFLAGVQKNLKSGGKLYLAIENRFDFKMFFGVRDPHVGLKFTTLMPRSLADFVSRKKLGRPYVNWLYSFGGIKFLLQQAGFSTVELYACFPDYRFPERILSYYGGLENYQPTISTRNTEGRQTLKRIIARGVDCLLFKVLKVKALSPSIVAIAHK